MQLSIFAGYHGDLVTLARILDAAPISKASARLAFKNGQRFQKSGVLCSCSQCNMMLQRKRK